MGFLGIGAMEALVILVIALIIFGPGRLPEMMGEAGRAVRDFRRATRELTGDFEDSIREVRETYDDLERDMRDTARDLKRDTQGFADEVNKAVASASKPEGTPQSTSSRRASATRPLDQDDYAFDPDEDLDQYFPATRRTGDTESSADGASTVQDQAEEGAAEGVASMSAEARATQPARPAKSPARKKVPAKRPAAAAAKTNGAAPPADDLLASEDGDDLLSIDN